MAFDVKKIKIPASSGCYLMKDQKGVIIYIGKAKNLEKRVKSYFNNTVKDEKTNKLIEKIRDIEFIVTQNEVEALLLEARLIKQHRPVFNLMLKDNQPYMYIKITDEELPQILSVRKIEGAGKYFGPFVGGKARKYLVLTTARLFGIKTNKINSASAKELYELLSKQHNKQVDNISKTEYRRNVRLAEMFLKGKKDKLINELEIKRNKASEIQNFELAKAYNDQINEIKRFSEKQLVSLPKSYDQDVINYVQSDDKIIIEVFNISKGVISSKKDFSFSYENNTDQVMYNFLVQYYLTQKVPKEIILPEKLLEHDLLIKYLNKLSGLKVVVTVPKIGDKIRLLELVKKNILNKLINNPAQTLQAALNLSIKPLEIDCFDISNIQGRFSAGSCVRFSKNKPNKDMYRRFQIKTVKGINDFAMIEEVVLRRYKHTEWSEPDLILIDGGKIQLDFAKRALKKLKLDIPVISIAKREEEIFTLNSIKPIILDKNSAALKMLQQLRDEAHRFAITYHKKLRKTALKGGK